MHYETWQLVLCGAGGGLLPDIIRFIKSRYDDQPIPYLKRWRFWISVALLVPLGALAAWVLEPKNPLQAFAFGYAAPELLSRVFSSEADKRTLDAPELKKNGVSPLRTWWAR
jgi:hypothetical protein